MYLSRNCSTDPGIACAHFTCLSATQRNRRLLTSRMSLRSACRSIVSALTLAALTLFSYLLSGIAHYRAEAQTLTNAATPYFIENRGQWPDDVGFLASLPGMNVWITADAIIYDFQEETRRPPSAILPADRSLDRAHGITRKGHVVAMRFAQPGGNDHAVGPRTGDLLAGPYRDMIFARRRAARGVDPLHAHCTYIGGRHAPRGLTAPLYSELWIDDVGGGIGMRLYFDAGTLRYDIVVPPGADPSALRFDIDGSTGLRINAFGELVMATALGEVLQRRLCAYQEYAGIRRRVSCAFELHPDGGVGFDLGSYDRKRPLVIDPLVWSTFLGGEGNDRSTGIARSIGGDIYITGYTSSKDFPAMVGAYDASPDGSPTAFVLKVSGDGSKLYYATFIGGEGGSWGMGITVDGTGCAYVAGCAGKGYPTTQGAFRPAPQSGIDAFATKLNAAGNALLYSTMLGGSGTDNAYAIALDASNAIYVGGSTTSEDFPTTSGAYDRTYNGGLDIFATRINPTGLEENDLQYSTTFGGTGSDAAYALAIDDSGTIYMTGASSSRDLPTTGGAYDSTLAGDSDAVLLRIRPKGSGAADLLYATFIGGSGVERGLGLALAGRGDAVIVGTSASSDLPVTAGAFDAVYNGGTTDAFCARIITSGAGAADLKYATYIGGSGSDLLSACVMAGASNIVAVGTSTSSDFPMTAGAHDASANGDSDLILLRLALQGAGNIDLAYSTYMGGSSADEGLACVMRGQDTIIVTGATTSAGFPSTLGTYDPTFNGGSDALVLFFVPDDGGSPMLWGMGGGVTQGFARPAESAKQGTTASMQAGPNPVSGCLRVRYHLDRAAFARIELTNAIGEMRLLDAEEWREPGAHAVELDVSALPSGTYIVTLIHDHERISRAIHIAR